MGRKILLGMLSLMLLQARSWAGRDYDETVREIQALNLIRGLELTPEQAGFIMSKGQQIEEMRQALDKKYQQYAPAYEELKRALLYGGEVPESVAVKIHKAQEDMRETGDKYREEGKKIALEVKDKLQAHQIYALEHYKPCLVPPKGEVRVGQVEDTVAFEGFLDRIRNVPVSVYEERKVRIAGEVIERGKKHLPRDYRIDENQVKGRIYPVFQEARSLSEVDFALKKKELAEKLKAPFTPPPPSPNVVHTIARFLLTPEAIRVLQETQRK